MLSKRLLEISKLVDKDKVVFDVGSDHGLLPCFLVKEGICPKAYASDNKEGPLSRAKETIRRYGLEGKVIPVLGDGIENIAKDVNVITICGMGFHTVKHILEGRDLCKYDKIIVQINKDTDRLRQFISDKGYTILDETVIDDGFYYEVEVFCAKSHNRYSGLQIRYGPVLMEKMDKSFIDLLKFRRRKAREIYKRSGDEKRLEQMEEIDMILKGNKECEGSS